MKSKRMIPVILFGIFFLFFGIKGCFHHNIIFKERAVYANTSPNGENDMLLLIPGNDIILFKSLGQQYEVAKFHIKGQNATHYFGPIYKMDNGIFGFGLYSNAKEVYEIESKLLKKDGNLKQSTFSNIGSESKSTLIIYSDKVVTGGIEYNRISVGDSLFTGIINEIDK